LVEILALWALLLFTTREFWGARRLAGALLLPYVAWVAFAASLTYAIWRRNPGVL
jgi:benzodiazapine receptor